MTLTKSLLTREQALAISPDYVAYVEKPRNFDKYDTVNAHLQTNLKRNQRVLAYYDNQFVEARITSINNNDIRAIDGPIIRVGNDEITWRIDGCDLAWPY